MNRTKVLFKRLRTPVTILMVPHGRAMPIRMQVSVFVILVCLCLSISGAFFLVKVSVSAIKYHQMETRLSHVTAEFNEVEDSMRYLRQADRDFRKMFSLKSKVDILELDDAVYSGDTAKSSDTAHSSDATYSGDDTAYSGSFDMKAFREQLDESMHSVTEIRDYIKNQKNIYRATPTGWPMSGKISSGYGSRSHPVYDEQRLHTGIDISASPGTEVKVTADGVVALAGRTDGGGIVVIVEHGHGFRTAYAHNSKVLVKVGQRVKRGDTIALSGSTGISTGPHLHYEVWKNGQHTNPFNYLDRKG